MAIKKWEQVDGDHFRGLCANEFWPMAGTGAGGCNVCVSPQVVVPPRCNCNGLSPVGVGIHLRHYLYIDGNALSPYLGSACWAPLLYGYFTLYYELFYAGQRFDFNMQGYRSYEKTVALSGNNCYAAGSIVPGFESYGAVPKAPLWVLDVACSNNKTTSLKMWPILAGGPGSPTGARWQWPLSTFFPPFVITPSVELFVPYQLCADKRYKIDVIYDTPFINPVVVGKMSSHPLQ